jgi:hypothetical protein
VRRTASRSKLVRQRRLAAKDETCSLGREVFGFIKEQAGHDLHLANSGYKDWTFMREL